MRMLTYTGLLARHDDQALTEAFSAWVNALLLPVARRETTPTR